MNNVNQKQEEQTNQNKLVEYLKTIPWINSEHIFAGDWKKRVVVRVDPANLTQYQYVIFDETQLNQIKAYGYKIGLIEIHIHNTRIEFVEEVAA